MLQETQISGHCDYIYVWLAILECIKISIFKWREIEIRDDVYYAFCFYSFTLIYSNWVVFKKLKKKKKVMGKFLVIFCSLYSPVFKIRYLDARLSIPSRPIVNKCLQDVIRETKKLLLKLKREIVQETC